MKIKTLLGSVAALTLISTACAQSNVKDDWSTPLAAARTYFTAIKAGDTNIFQRAALGTPYEKAWMAAYVRSSIASDKLEKAGTGRFGHDETAKAFGEILRSCDAATAVLSGLTNAETKLDGTNATVKFHADASGNTPDPVQLQQVGAQWKIVLGEDIEKVDFNKDGMEAMAEATAQCAADIGTGKYKTAAEASQGMMSAFMAKMQSQQNPILQRKE